MNIEEALREASKWLAYIDGQRRKADRMQSIAKQARVNPAEAREQLRLLDNAPVVYDGAKLEEAVKVMIAEIEQLKALLQEARDDIAERVEATTPFQNLRYPIEHRRYRRDMSIVQRIDAALTGEDK